MTPEPESALALRPEAPSTTFSARERRLADVPVKYRGLYKRAYAAKSRKAAIRAFCLECTYWQFSEVALCTAPACPLYEYRLKG